MLVLALRKWFEEVGMEEWKRILQEGMELDLILLWEEWI